MTSEGQGEQPPQRGEIRTYAQGRYRLIINRAWCKGCELCVRSCPTHILELDDEVKVYVTDLSKCLFCGLCEERCPDFAISVEKPSVLELEEPGEARPVREEAVVKAEVEAKVEADEEEELRAGAKAEAELATEKAKER